MLCACGQDRRRSGVIILLPRPDQGDETAGSRRVARRLHPSAGRHGKTTPGRRCRRNTAARIARPNSGSSWSGYASSSAERPRFPAGTIRALWRKIGNSSQPGAATIALSRPRRSRYQAIMLAGVRSKYPKPTYSSPDAFLCWTLTHVRLSEPSPFS